MHRRRGIGLGVTILIVTLMAVVGFTLASLTVSRIQLLSNLQQRRKARSLARSAIAATLSNLQTSSSYGASGGDTPVVVPGETSDSLGRLVFDPATAAQMGIIPSTNNLGGVAAVQSAGPNPQLVPAFTARLVAEGRSAGLRERLEALVTIPVFPYALASTGSISSNQGLIVAGLSDNSATGRANLLADPVHYGTPANLVSNAAGPNSVQILGPSTICGDLQSSGQVDLTGSPIQVLGELRQNAVSAAIPDIQLAALNPVTQGLNPSILSGSPSDNPTLQGSVLCNGSFVAAGNLTLNSALLYVKGNLDVGGHVVGQGTVVVEGTTHFHGTTDLSSLGQVGLVSQGDILLDGTGSANSFFQGLVYTRGKLTAHGLMVFGCLLGASPGPTAGPQINLQDCVVVQNTAPILNQASSASVICSADIHPVIGSPPGPTGILNITESTPNNFELKFQCSNQPEKSFDAVLTNCTDPTAQDSFWASVQSQSGGLGGLVFGVGSTFFSIHQPDLSQLANLQHALPPPTNALFDINQFLRYNDKLRQATCRVIP